MWKKEGRSNRKRIISYAKSEESLGKVKKKTLKK